MPAKAGIHALFSFASNEQKIRQASASCFEKKEPGRRAAKNFHLLWAVASPCQRPQGQKVFCFAAGQAFFPKKKRLLCLRA